MRGGEGEEGMLCTVFRSFRKFEILEKDLQFLEDDRKEGCRAPAGEESIALSRDSPCWSAHRAGL